MSNNETVYTGGRAVVSESGLTGPPGINDVGVYDEEAEYVERDAVTLNGSTFFARRTVPVGETPQFDEDDVPVNDDNWLVLTRGDITNASIEARDAAAASAATASTAATTATTKAAEASSSAALVTAWSVATGAHVGEFENGDIFVLEDEDGFVRTFVDGSGQVYAPNVNTGSDANPFSVKAGEEEFISASPAETTITTDSFSVVSGETTTLNVQESSGTLSGIDYISEPIGTATQYFYDEDGFVVVLADESGLVTTTATASASGIGDFTGEELDNYSASARAFSQALIGVRPKVMFPVSRYALAVGIGQSLKSGALLGTNPIDEPAAFLVPMAGVYTLGGDVVSASSAADDEWAPSTPTGLQTINVIHSANRYARERDDVQAVLGFREGWLDDRYMASDPTREFVVAVHAIGSTVYEEWVPDGYEDTGSSPRTQYRLWNGVPDIISTFTSYAGAETKQILYWSIELGESNQSTAEVRLPNGDLSTASVDYTTIRGYLQDIVDEMRSIESDLGQSRPSPVFIYQTRASGTAVDAADLGLQMAQLRICNDNKFTIFNDGPTYRYPDNGIHLLANSYRWRGELRAFILRHIAKGNLWLAMQPIFNADGVHQIYARRRTIVIPCHVPFGELTVTQPYNLKDLVEQEFLGLAVFGPAEQMTISSVQFSRGNLIVIQTSADVAEGGRVNYADAANNGLGSISDSNPAVGYQKWTPYTVSATEYESIAELDDQYYPLKTPMAVFSIPYILVPAEEDA